MSCSICNHKLVSEINAEILEVDGVEISLETIVRKYDLEPKELQIHALLHLNPANKTSDTSLVANLNIKEATILESVYIEYLATLQKLSSLVQTGINIAESGDVPLDRMIARSTVDLYLGAGSQIRDTIGSIVDLDKALNKDRDGELGAIKELIKAVRG